MFCTSCGKEISEDSKVCSNCGKEVVKAGSDKKTVNVVWHRKKSFVGCAMPLKIFVDGNEIAKLKNNGTCETEIACGNHKVVLDLKTALGEKELVIPEDNTKMYIEVGVKMGFFTGKVEILSIKNEK